MPSIKLKSLEFGEVQFRKLKGLKIDFASRITLIAGHNGIGKSTILGLTANTSGLTRLAKAPPSYFGKTFQADFSEIIFVDYESEFVKAKAADLLPSPLIEYVINGNETLGKRCALTERNQKDKAQAQARIVSRNSPATEKFTSKDGSIEVGVASKVPLPTLYLGMTRVLPLGEAEEESVSSDVIDAMPEEDRQMIADFVNGVIVGINASNDSITTNKIKGTRKFSSHPKYDHDAKCVSIGQDSIGSIAAAIASFQMLKREWDAYPGGLLIIDELDSGLHPHAIGRMVEQLEIFAEKLNLQIIATTHSTRLIQAVYPKNKSSKNSVVYLMDTKSPYLMPAASLQAILDDMDLLPPTSSAADAKPSVRVYLEDEEAAYIFNLLVPPAKKREIGKANSVKLKAIALGVGCDSLANLSIIDPHFRLSIFALDADANLRKKHLKYNNVIKMPGENNMSPERTLFSFIEKLVGPGDKDHSQTWISLRGINVTTNQLQAHLLNWNGNVSDRVHAKKWWRSRKEYIKNWKLFEAWMKENPAAVTLFHNQFAAAVKAVAKQHRRLAKTGSTG